MSRAANIIVVETSLLLYEGIAQVVTLLDVPFRISQARSMEEAERLICERPDSLLIVNPAFVYHSIKSFQVVKNRWEGTRWLALVYQHFEQKVLGLFNGTISISDSQETILGTIRKALSASQPKVGDGAEDILSEREIEVLRLLAMGFSNKEVADRLNISVNTAITHRKNISQKTGIKTVSGLTIYAVVNKFIDIENVK